MLRDPMSLFLLAILVFAAAIFAQPQPDKAAQTDVKMAIPGVKGALEINLGVPYWMEDLSEEGKEVQLRAMGRPDHLLITAFLQRVKFSASPEKCRSEWWSLTKKNPLIGPRENLDESAIKDGIAQVEFILPVFRGEKVNQKNTDRGSMDACLEQLGLAYLYKENMIPGDDELPNPLEEDSFRRFFNDPKFVRVVREMQRQH